MSREDTKRAVRATSSLANATPLFFGKQPKLITHTQWFRGGNVYVFLRGNQQLCFFGNQTQFYVVTRDNCPRATVVMDTTGAEAVVSWALAPRLRHLTLSNPGLQAIGSQARHAGWGG